MTINQAKRWAACFFNEANIIKNCQNDGLACSLETAACVIDHLADKLRRASTHATQAHGEKSDAERLAQCYEGCILDALACLRYGRTWEALQILKSMEEVINEA